jgi:cytochrome P450
MTQPKPIPGPRGHFFTGSLREARERPLELMVEIARDYGDLAQVRVGPLRMVLITHPDHVKHVLQEQHARYGRPAFVPLLRRVVGNGLLFSEGELWLRQRRTMQPMFHRERIAGFARIMGEAVSKRVAAWRSRTSEAPLDLSREMSELSFEIVGRALFSTDLTAQAGELGAAIQRTLKWLEQRTVQPFSTPLFIPTAENRGFRAAQKLFARTIDAMLAERRSGAHDPGDLLSMLLAARDPDTGAGMSDEQLRAEVLTFLIAGYETTSAALEWTLLLLSRHPDAAERVRAEHLSVCGERPPIPDDLPRMPYTRMVIDEALRLYPPVFGLSRRVIADDELGGYAIKKGVQLLVSPYAVHRNPAFWPDPERFDPERFAPERAKQRPRYAHIPFGAGPRQCIGNAFALMELQVVIPTLIGALRFELAPGADPTPQPRMTLRPRGPLLMNVRPA